MNIWINLGVTQLVLQLFDFVQLAVYASKE